MDFERSSFEISRVLNLVESRGWEETARSVEGGSLSVSVVKNLDGLDLRERRMCLDDLATIVRVFGWEFESSGIGDEKASATMIKVLAVEDVDVVGP